MANVKISELPLTQAVGNAATGTLIVRQTGGVVGTDEVQISHDGTRGFVASVDGELRLVNSSATPTTATSYVAIATGAGGLIVYGSGNQVLALSDSTAAIFLAANGALQWSDTINNVGTGKDLSLGRAAAGQLVQGGATATAGGATTLTRTVIKKTGIADNTATAVITVTVPNANHAAGIKLKFLASTGSTDAFESSRVAEGFVVVARTTGVNAVATAATLEMAAIATVAAGATLTLAYSLSAISGAVGATNTFDIRVTLDDSGNVGSNQVVVVAELINAEASGVTMAAA